VEPGEWDSLFRSPHLRNLTALTVSASGPIPPEAVVGVLQSPWSAKLEELNLNCENLSIEHLSPLFGRPVEGPTPLHSLRVPDCEGIGQTLAGWPGLAGIASLSLTRMYGQRCEGDTAALLRSPHLSRRLARLDLSGSCRTRANVKQLAACPALAGLRWLCFEWNGLNPEKLRILMRAPHLRHLEALHLSSAFGDEVQALTELARSREWPRLRDVVVGSGTAREGIEALSQRFGPRLRVWADC
jgi:hypothetical protein